MKTLGALGVFIAGLAAACEAKPIQPIAQSSTAQPLQEQATVTTTATAPSACPSWENLDLSTLAPVPVSPYAAIFEQVWETVRTRHYDVTLACLDWPKFRSEYGQQIAQQSTRDGAYRVLNAMLSRLGQSHVQAMPPPSGRPHRALLGGPAQIDAPVVWLGDDLVVRPPRPGERKGLVAPGAIVEAIDGAPLRDFVDHQAVHSPIARMSALAGLWACPEGATRQVTTRQGKTHRDYNVSCRLPAGEPLSMGHLHGMVGRVHGEMLTPKVGYLSFSVWMLPLVAKITHALQELQTKAMQTLILDLRGNHGGVATMPIPIARQLLSEGGSLGHLAMRGFAQELVVRANPAAFRGNLIILIDRESASTTELFALGMHELGRATLVGGSPSAGMALPSLIEGLPDGGLLQHVVGDFRSVRGKVAEGAGLMPDKLVAETADELRLNGDVVLKAALAIAQGMSH